MILKTIDIPIYYFKLKILVSDDPIEVRKVIKNFRRGNVFAHTAYNEESSTVCIVINPKYKHDVVTHGVIAHEAVHAAGFVLKDRGIQADFDNDEPHTYLTEWICNQIYKFLDKNKLMRKIKSYR